MSCNPLDIKVPLAGEEVFLPESLRCRGHKRKEKRQQKTGDSSHSLRVLDVLPDPPENEKTSFHPSLDYGLLLALGLPQVQAELSEGEQTIILLFILNFPLFSLICLLLFSFQSSQIAVMFILARFYSCV